MLKKLRIKFVAIIMAIVAVVLLAVFSTICVVSYQQAVSEVYVALNAAIDHDSMPKKEPLAATLPPEDAFSEGDLAPSSERSESEGDRPFEIGGKGGGKQFIPVAVYEIGADGSLTAVSDVATASIADDVLKDAAKMADGLADGSGLVETLGLYYVKHTNDTGTFIAFADQASAQGWQSLALTLAAVGVGALLVFLVISLLFSNWALHPVAESWRKQQQFVADASHELKTPLTVMLANTSILLKHPEKTVACQSNWVESIETEATNMQRLVGDMLLLATPDRTKHVQTQMFAPVNLSDMVERNLLQFESLAFERAIEVDSDIEDDICIEGSAPRLERLVSTLLDNAYKYAGEHGRIGVTLKQASRRIELVIFNSGDVIPPEDLPYIFDRFYRVDKARERSVGGYGLGLAIAREVAEEHGGTIGVRSSMAEGTVFTVEWATKASRASKM